ncbi:hypothetical protein ASZ78_006986 [Callipepla squamata]|uniref:GOLD domain-containing protein n=1 Tax=Callipepla squamata TaxID=9009 RepID=A0A226MNM9_CALSU|nr:hypothetical protein ASZ78_006986 [Callipepla squamata]
MEDMVKDFYLCFYSGNYKIQKWDMHEREFLDSAPGLGMFVTVTTPTAEVNILYEYFCMTHNTIFYYLMNSHIAHIQHISKLQVILSKLYGPTATFSFTSYMSGEHVICLQSNSTRLVAFAGSKLRIHLDIRVGEHFLDEAVVQAKDKVNEVNVRIEHLLEQIHHISKEQNYEREREEKFRKTSEQTNSNILWWAVVQTLILVSIGIWQIKSLKDFFIAKKLV